MFKKFPNRHFNSLDDKFIPAHQLAASLIDLAISRGADKNRLTRGTGIFYQDIKSGKAQLSAKQILHLISNVKAQVSGYDCAFQLGQRLFPGNYGHISNAIMHSCNMLQAFRILSIHRMQICPFLYTEVFRDDNQYHLVIEDAMGCGEHYRFLVETYFSALVSALKFLMGHKITIEFDFPFARPKYYQEYEANLGFKLRFSQPLLRIRMDKSFFHEPFTQQSPSLRSHALQQIKQNAHYPPAFLEAVKKSIKNNRQYGLREAATYFSMSPATFKRKLKYHGAGFQQLQDNAGKQQAVNLLQIKKLSNEESAAAMAFNDIPNFRRAVKRWTGLTPKELRIGTEKTPDLAAREHTKILNTAILGD